MKSSYTQKNPEKNPIKSEKIRKNSKNPKKSKDLFEFRTPNLGVNNPSQLLWSTRIDWHLFFYSAEFLLGDDLLAAPVLEPGAVSRDIYLPSGQWRDEADPLHPIYTGPLWLRNYPAALDTLPYFTRVKPSEMD